MLLLIFDFLTFSEEPRLNQHQTFDQIIYDTLVDHKAQEVCLFDVRHLTSITDHMLVCTGTSTRHVKALSDYVIEASKKAGVMPLGTEGERDAEWILVDLGFVVVHIMLASTRAFYNLEKLWDSTGMPPAESQTKTS